MISVAAEATSNPQLLTRGSLNSMVSISEQDTFDLCIFLHVIKTKMQRLILMPVEGRLH